MPRNWIESLVLAGGSASEDHAHKGYERGDQGKVVKTAGVILPGVDGYVAEIGTQGIACGSAKVEAAEAAPAAVRAQNRDTDHNDQGLIADGVSHIKVEIVARLRSGQEAKGKHSEREKIERVDHQNENIEETKGAEMVVLPAVRRDGDGGGERNYLDEEKNIGQRNIRNELGETQFAHRPDSVADGPQKGTGKDQKPEDAHARMAAKEILEAENGDGGDQTDLQSVAKGR